VVYLGSKSHVIGRVICKGMKLEEIDKEASGDRK
jgi:hypothetical protein